jgi:hypothetical protein
LTPPGFAPIILQKEACSIKNNIRRETIKEITLTAKEATFRLSYEADGSGDYLIGLEAAVEGFRGHADGHIVGKDWLEFRNDLNKLEQDRKGKAHLGSALPEEFDIFSSSH